MILSVVSHGIICIVGSAWLPPMTQQVWFHARLCAAATQMSPLNVCKFVHETSLNIWDINKATVVGDHFFHTSLYEDNTALILSVSVNSDTSHLDI